MLLESMYDKPVEITSTNAYDVYVAATRFGMKTFSQKAEEIVCSTVKTVSTATFLEAYAKAMETKNPLTEKVWTAALASKTGHFSIETILEFTGKMSFDEIVAFIELEGLTCHEDTLYEITTNWIQSKSTSIFQEQAYTLMSSVKLDLLSSSVLLTKARNYQYVSLKDFHQTLEKIVYKMGA